MSQTVAIEKLKGGYVVKDWPIGNDDDAVFADGNEREMVAEVMRRLLCPDRTIDEVLGSAVLKELL